MRFAGAISCICRPASVICLTLFDQVARAQGILAAVMFIYCARHLSLERKQYPLVWPEMTAEPSQKFAED